MQLLNKLEISERSEKERKKTVSFLELSGCLLQVLI